MKFKSFFFSLLCVLPAFGNASSLELGKFSAIYTQLVSEPILFKGQAAVYVDFKVFSLAPVDRSTPKQYYSRAIPDPKKCSLSVPFVIADGMAKHYQNAEIQCPVKNGYGYVADFDFVLHRQNERTGRFEELTCAEGDSCSRYIMRSGNHLFRVMSESKFVYQKLKAQ